MIQPYFASVKGLIDHMVLDQILSGEQPEVTVEKIHDYLSKMGEDVRSEKIRTEGYIIFKRLGKNSEDYSDAKIQPHVQVALRMKKKGLPTRAGDVIPYIFCIGDDGQSPKAAQADRARHLDEIRRAETVNNKINYEYCLSQQLLPPIERLREPLEGTERSRLAGCLRLDPSKYRGDSGNGGSEEEEHAFSTLSSRTFDEARLKDVKRLVVSCTGCDGQMEFESVHDRERSILKSTGLSCPACSHVITTIQFQVQLEVQI